MAVVMSKYGKRDLQCQLQQENSYHRTTDYT